MTIPKTDESPGHRLRLGEQLVGRGAITTHALAAALEEQARTGARLGEVLVHSGSLPEQELVGALSDQLGIPLVDLRRTAPEPDALVALPELVARRWRVLPIRIGDEGLEIAVAGPLEREAMDEIQGAAATPVSLVLAPASDLQRVIDRAYHALTDMSRYVEAFEVEGAARAEAAPRTRIPIDENAPVVQIISRILTQAVRDRASDVHIEPQDIVVRVRFRIDGALHEATTLPVSMAQALVSRVKILADMNIVERRRAQDGQFQIDIDGRPLDVRVATAATVWGEKAVLRLLDKSRSLLELGLLGMSAETRREFGRLIRSPFGMIICAGPTGSGKTTTLYAALNEINDAERNITTIEDPVEYLFPAINQIQINEQAEITFAGGLKAILRQDPDIILVGEIRDVETARIAVQSALTGHLVLSSLHATDAVAALQRFLDMGIESFLIASSVIAVIAQRLVRRICDACRETYRPTAEELAIYESWSGEPRYEFSYGTGCNFCAHTGYSDRIGMFELLRVDEEVKRLVVAQASHDELRAAGLRQGMRTLRDDAIRLVDEGVTTIAELVRAIYTL